MPHPVRPVRLPIRRAAKGMAALTIVMVLFFVMAMVAAYTNRNLIFEQRVAANSYRAEQALLAADAGSEWAQMLLNSGRVDDNCRPSSNTAHASPRQRYLKPAPAEDDGSPDPERDAAGDPLYASCVISLSGGNTQLTCVCPTAANPDPSPHAVKNWPTNVGGSAFRVHWQRADGDANPAKPGAVVVTVRGCASPGSGADSCAAVNDRPAADAVAGVRVMLGLVRALPVPPVAALTLGGDAVANGAILSVGNPDAATGFTVRAGGNLQAGGTEQLRGPAGSSDDGRVLNDSALSTLKPVAADRFGANDRFFQSMFGLDAPAYREQPAVARYDCTAGAGSCSTADVETALNRYPGMAIWFDGDLNLATAPTGGTLGTAAQPVLLIVTGRLSVQAGAALTGLVYARDIDWAAAGSLQGAAVALENFTATADVTLVYDPAVLKTIQLRYGSFVRAPGGWSRVM